MTNIDGVAVGIDKTMVPGSVEALQNFTIYLVITTIATYISLLTSFIFQPGGS